MQHLVIFEAYKLHTRAKFRLMAKKTNLDQLTKPAEEEPEILFIPETKTSPCESEDVWRQLPRSRYIKDVKPANDDGTDPLISVKATNLHGYQKVQSKKAHDRGADCGKLDGIGMVIMGRRDVSAREAHNCVSAVHEEKLDSKVPDMLFAKRDLTNTSTPSQ